MTTLVFMVEKRLSTGLGFGWIDLVDVGRLGFELDKCEHIGQVHGV